MAATDEILKAILSTTARQAFPPAQLLELVAPQANSGKQIAVYNLCDGEHTQAEIAAAVKVDKANLSRSISKWIELGIMFRTGNGAEMRPMHLYPLPPTEKRKKS
jgi:predicted transcriptional regulator